jgi:hypothetical protein
MATKAHCSQLVPASCRSKFVSLVIRIQLPVTPIESSDPVYVHAWPIQVSLVASAIVIDCGPGADKSKTTHTFAD